MKKNHVRKYMRRGEIRRVWKKAVSILSCIVVFVTTYMLLLPAITMEKTAICGIEAHQHDESCWETETKLTCGLDEEDGHQHTEDCFTTTRKLICTLEQHTHSEQCYNTKEQPSCALEEHSHTDECFREDRFLSCPLEETADHQHTEDCYKYEKVLICGKEAHTHTPECFGEDASGLPSGAEGVEDKALDNAFDAANDATDHYDSGTETGNGEDLTYENTRGNEPGDPSETSTADEAISDENATENIFDESGDEDARMTDSETGELSGNNEETETGTDDTEILDPSDGSEGFDGSDEDEASDSETADPSLEDGEIETVDPETGENSGENETSDAETAESSEENEASDPEPGSNSGENETSDAEAGENSGENETSDAEAGENSGENETSDAETVESSEENGTSDAETADSTDENGTVDAGEAPSSEGTVGTENTETAAEASGEGTGDTQAASESASGTASGTTSGEVKPGLSKTLTFEGPDYTVTASFDENAGIPSGASLSVEEITQDQDNYKKYSEQAEKAVGEEIEGKAAWVRLFDITIVKDGQTIEPTGPVSIQINYHEAMERPKNAEVKAVHFEGEKETPVVLDTKAQGEETSVEQVSFDTESFSVFAIVGTTIEKTVLASGGHNYKIRVTYGEDAGVPDGAELEVNEILQNEEATDEATEYETYLEKAREALGLESGVFEYARFFDIKIVDENGEKVQITAPVDVKIELADKESGEKTAENTKVVHFADGSEGGDVVEITTEPAKEGQVVSFEAEGFSVYAIVDGPSATSVGWHKVTSMNDLLTHTEGLYIGHTDGYYFKNTIVSDNNGRNGIGKTSPAQDAPSTNTAARYYFESAGPAGQYYVYCLDGGIRRYIKNNNNKSLEFGIDEGDKTAFTVSVDENGVFRFNNGKWYWNMQGGNSGNRFCSWDDATDPNAKMNVWYHDENVGDPYGLGGQTYGLLTWNGGKTAKALMASENSGTDEEGNTYQGCLEAKFLTVMTNEDNSDDKLYVPKNTADTITDWTFEWQRDDIYYVKGKDDNGSTKYLCITSNGLSLLDTPDNTCEIQVVPGAAGIHKGQIALKSAGSGGETLTYSGKYAQGFGIGGEAGSEWLYLATDKPEEILTDYVKVNSATKVSVSDTEKVYTGQKVIIYTREWVNDHYEYYAVNSRGELVPCAESGDSIEWIGGNLNDMLWQFTEYCYEGTNTPSGYYELQNLYAASNGDPSYLAPKYSEAGTLRGILSESTVGILLEGRQRKQYYSSIVAWDTPRYMYSGLTVDLDKDNPVIMPCVKADGLDFYFAVMEDLPVDDELHTVPTVDNDQYGIVMRMIDLRNGKTSDATGQMNAFLGNTTTNGMTTNHTPGLLSTNLTDGYPTAAGGSLAQLFAAGEVMDSNHLFIESIYRATGYYEYNSAQNFASLTSGGDFVVYQELGTNDTTSKNTLKHGQFFPYNDIKPGSFASANGENLYSATGTELADSDPRKHEQLYLVEGATDYYFAMELEASFEQTPSGLDAWGHDIIFEFSGDDDFWLYVDGELVIDLGGIHSAVPGSVNFRTGVVNVNGTQTTLYDLFYNNYKDRGHTDAEALEYVNSRFERNSNGQYVFKDGTNHTMRIFYMERGAGASNLHMKFNLAAVKKGTVQLSKELGGVDSLETSYAAFPYQVYYTMEDKPEAKPQMLRNAFDPSSASVDYYQLFGTEESTNYVFYKDRTQPVTFLPELKVGSTTYYNVFMLKPDETAEINFPVRHDDPSGNEYTVGEYRIVECGVDPAVYTQVTVNGEVLTGEQDSGDNRYMNYGIDMATTAARPKVNYVNTPKNLQSLELTKELYKKLYRDEQPQKIELYNSDGNYIGTGIQDSDLETAKKAVFNYRLYFKSPYDDDFVEANQVTYHVKDPAGYYCRWDYSAQTFVRITDSVEYPGGTKNFDELTKDYVDEDGTVVHRDRFWSSFETGTHGSTTGIPAYYTVEVRELVPGTEYRIIERPTETPDGYKFWQYENDKGIMHTDTDPYDPGNGIDGTISTGDGSKVWVRNYKGYGICLKKTWEDASTMKDRDPAHFAVYRVNSDGSPVQLVPDSVRQLGYAAKQELYWWYLSLPFDNTGLRDYSVFEVKLNGSVNVSEDGVVTVDPDDVEPVVNGGINTIRGTLNGQDEAKPIEYTVTYKIEPNENDEDNVRVVLADNAPSELPPVQFVKHDWSDNALPGAVFSLQYGEGSSAFDTDTKTSGPDGSIGRVYLQENVDYTLTELQAPQGFAGLDTPLVVTLQSTTSGWALNVTPGIPAGDPVSYYVSEEEGVLTLTVKNRPYDLEMVKVDSTDHTVRLAGAKFNLFKQQTIGDIQTWDEEHPVYTGLTTNENGVIPDIDSLLPSGTYQLRETASPDGYTLPTGGYTNFTVTEMGRIIPGVHPDEVTFTETTDGETGRVTYTVMIPNHPLPIKLKKTDEAGEDLTGARFSLKKWNGACNSEGKRIWSMMEEPLQNYNSIDMADISVFGLDSLPNGYYQLTETAAPSGYVITQDKFYFVINKNRTVKLCKEDGTEEADEIGQAKLSKSKDGVYTITIKNTPGAALPNTGGPGTRLYTILGSILVIFAGVLLVRIRHRSF